MLLLLLLLLCFFVVVNVYEICILFLLMFVVAVFANMKQMINVTAKTATLVVRSNKLGCNNDEVCCSSCYDEAGLKSCYNKAGRNSCCNEVGWIGILLITLPPDHVVTAMDRRPPSPGWSPRSPACSHIIPWYVIYYPRLVTHYLK